MAELAVQSLPTQDIHSSNPGANEINNFERSVARVS